MKYRIFFVGLILFLIYGLTKNQSPKAIKQSQANIKLTPPEQLKPEQYLTPKLKINPIKPNEPPQELSHEEFVGIEKKHAEQRLKESTLGWCNASESDVTKFYTETLITHRKHSLPLKNICLNQKNKNLECFTYQAFCPSKFEETNELTLLQFWSGEKVYRYERRVMDYKTYVQNPENPPFPGTNYWIARAHEIKILAERVRGEPASDQSWGMKDNSDN